MNKYMGIALAVLFSVSSLFAETDAKALKAIKALRYGTSDEYNLVSPKVKTRISVDTINEYTGAAGVTIDSVVLKDGGVTSIGTVGSTNAAFDVIAEKTSATGVTVDGVLLKDNNVTATSVIVDRLISVSPLAQTVTNGEAITLTETITRITPSNVSTCTFASATIGGIFIIENVGTNNLIFEDNGTTLALGANITNGATDVMGLFCTTTNQMRLMYYQDN